MRGPERTEEEKGRKKIKKGRKAKRRESVMGKREPRKTREERFREGRKERDGKG